MDYGIGSLNFIRGIVGLGWFKGKKKSPENDVSNDEERVIFRRIHFTDHLTKNFVEKHTKHVEKRYLKLGCY